MAIFLKNTKVLFITFCFLLIVGNNYAQVAIDLDTAVYRTLTYSIPLHMASDETQSRHYQVKQAGRT